MNCPGDVLTRALQGRRTAPEIRYQLYWVTCPDSRLSTGTFILMQRTQEVFGLQFQTSEISVDPRNLAMRH